MATDLPRFTITLPDEMYNDVTRFQRDNNIKTQSKAIQRLVALGLDASAKQNGEEPRRAPSPLEKQYAALDAHGRRLVDLVMVEESRRVEQVREPVVYNLGTIRHYLYSPAAGPDGQISGSDYEDLPRTQETPHGADYCLTVSGDSMMPYLYDGQMIYVSEDGPVRPLEIGVFFYRGAVYVKQYSPEPDGSIVLLSANPARERNNVIIPAESVPDLICYGKVLGIKKPPRPVYYDDSQL